MHIHFFYSFYLSFLLQLPVGQCWLLRIFNRNYHAASISSTGLAVISYPWMLYISLYWLGPPTTCLIALHLESAVSCPCFHCLLYLLQFFKWFCRQWNFIWIFFKSLALMFSYYSWKLFQMLVMVIWVYYIEDPVDKIVGEKWWLGFLRNYFYAYCTLGETYG